MSRRANRVDWVLFGLLGLIWGSSFLFIKIGVETLPPFTLVTLRLLFGAVFLAAVIVAAREPLPRDRTVYRHLAILGVLSIFIPFTLITWGEQHIDSGLAAILNATTPLFTIVVASLALHDEPITVNRVLGLLVGFTGVVVIVSRGLGGAADGSSIYGELAVALASLSYGFGAVYARRNVHGIRPMTIGLGQVASGLLITAPLAILVDQPFGLSLEPDAIFAVVWLGVLGSGVAYLIFYRILAHWGATRASLVTYLLPIVGVALGVAVRDEPIDARIIGGTVLVIGGVALVNSRYGARRLFGRARRPLPAEIEPS
jgi:drug/metabolite transporter (DMT)-like permease